MKKRHDRSVRELQEMTHGMSAYLERQRDFFSAGADLADVSFEYFFGRLCESAHLVCVLACLPCVPVA